MAIQTDITQTTTGDLTEVNDYSSDPVNLDGPQDPTKTRYSNPDFPKWLGYYDGSNDKANPELKQALHRYATWVLGMGYTVSPRDKSNLDLIRGMGEDTFNSILWNMLVIKKVNGDSYAQIIRDEDKLNVINIKPLNCSRITTVIGGDGIIEEYEYRDASLKQVERILKPSEVLHLMNDRIGDQVHGTSTIKAIQWALDAKKEASHIYRKILKRSNVRILYVEEDDKTRLSNLQTDYKDAIDKGDLLILPIKVGEGKFEDLQLPPVQSFLAWIQNLDNVISNGVGIPKIIGGDGEGTTESGGKMVYLGFEPIYMREIIELEADLWNQLGIKITFNRPPSITDNVSQTESKNQAQTSIQPNDITGGSGK